MFSKIPLKQFYALKNLLIYFVIYVKNPFNLYSILRKFNNLLKIITIIINPDIVIKQVKKGYGIFNNILFS